MIAHARKISLGGALALLLIALPSTLAAKERGVISGTYSTLKYNDESGDLSGYEIQIVPVAGGYKAVLQLAEGEVTDVVVSDASIDKSGLISAAFVFSSGEGCKLRAKLREGKLVGVLSFDKSGDVEVAMPRSAGYWDRR